MSCIYNHIGGDIDIIPDGQIIVSVQKGIVADNGALPDFKFVWLPYFCPEMEQAL